MGGERINLQTRVSSVRKSLNIVRSTRNTSSLQPPIFTSLESIHDTTRTMKFSTLFLAVSSALAATTGVLADAPAPEVPVLKHLYTMNCTLDTPVVVGPGPKGYRAVLPIIGGTFSGKHLSGTSISPTTSCFPSPLAYCSKPSHTNSFIFRHYHEPRRRLGSR